MKLYFTPGACSLGPHIALEWTGAEYQAISTPFADPSLKDVFPEGSGKVPILDREDGSKPLTQSPAILRYIADRYPESNIAVSDSIEDAAEVNRWLVFLCSDLHPAFHPVFVGERYTKDTNEDAIEAVRQAATDMVRKELSILNNHLEGKTYIVGERPSIADAYAFPMLRWSMDKLPEKLDKHPNLQRLHDTMAINSGVIAVLNAEGLQ